MINYFSWVAGPVFDIIINPVRKSFSWVSGHGNKMKRYIQINKKSAQTAL